jgi:uncharacterized protein (UPF0333 family)
MKKRGKIYLYIVLALLVSLLILIIYSHFNPFQFKKSLSYDEGYVKNKMYEFLKDNPKANESYAKEVVYHGIAIAEKNSAICDKIKTEWLREDCYNYFKVTKR